MVGYYLLNDLFETKTLSQRKDIIQDLIEQGKLPNGNYAYSLQCATDLHYLNRGISKLTLSLLKELTRSRYDFFIGIMDKENEWTIKVHQNSEWFIFGDVGIGILAVLSTDGTPIEM